MAKQLRDFKVEVDALVEKVLRKMKLSLMYLENTSNNLKTSCLKVMDIQMIGQKKLRKEV